MEFGRKRAKPEAGLNGNAGSNKKKKQETESFGLGSKSKPCTKFFSTAGCPFGEGCHFLHYVPGGINAVNQMTNVGGNPVITPRNAMGPPSFHDGASAPVAKTKLCNKFNTPEGCKFGDKCHFAHGERELGVPLAPHREDPRSMGPPIGRFAGRPGPTPPEHAAVASFGGFGGRPGPTPPEHAAAASFGASATAKISVDASLAGAIIGKGGVNSKQICRITGVTLSIKEHESDANLRNIELEGTFDQIKQASTMVRELIGGHMNKPAGPAPTPANNFKTKLCENFSKGSCTFGEKCHFAHGAAELRKQGP